MGSRTGLINQGRRSNQAMLLLVAMSLLVWVTACNRNGSQTRFASTSDAGASNPPLKPDPPSTTAAPGISYADVVQRASPAVITIHSTMQARAPEQYPFMDDPMFREFFGERGRAPQQAPRQRRGLGSGVIVSQDGYILTNHHVVDGAEQIKVDLSDNRTIEARLVGSDPPSDLALLKIEASNLPVLALGDSDRTRVGDVVLAIGNPMGIGQTVTMGIISAKGRTTGLSAGNFEDFLQTDAPINQGNSGGALVSTNSELIGINSQILSPSGGSIGIGFAIPSNMARTVMESLARNGKVRRGQLGIIVVPTTSEVAEKFKLRDQKGVFVMQIQPGGAADRAGLQPNDVIIRFNGTEVNEPNTFRNLVAGTAPGTDVTLTIVRDGREQQINARLGEFTPQPPRAER